MGVFESPEIFEKVLLGFFNQMAENQEITKKLLASKLTVRFKYTDPDLVIFADCTGDKMIITAGNKDSKAEIEMSMSADIAHKFWFGKVNLVMALTRRQIVAKGPIPKALKLLPAIKPAYELYPKYLEENGFSKYIIY